MTEPLDPNQSTRPRRAGRGVLAFILGAVTAGVLGVFAGTAFGEGSPWHRPWHAMGPLTQAQIEDHADRAVRHIAIEIDATADQQSKLQSIVKSALNDLLPLRDKSLAARQQARALLTQPTVDRAAIERLRTEQVSAFETASKRITQAVADAADALTPEQRKKLDELLPPPGSHWRPWYRD
jgi:Spy/CpxP family protein refolding chaperone